MEVFNVRSLINGGWTACIPICMHALIVSSLEL